MKAEERKSRPVFPIISKEVRICGATVNEKLAISFMSRRKALLVEFDRPFLKHSSTPIQDRLVLTICEYLGNV